MLGAQGSMFHGERGCHTGCTSFVIKFAPLCGDKARGQERKLDPHVSFAGEHLLWRRGRKTGNRVCDSSKRGFYLLWFIAHRDTQMMLSPQISSRRNKHGSSLPDVIGQSY